MTRVFITAASSLALADVALPPFPSMARHPTLFLLCVLVSVRRRVLVLVLVLVLCHHQLVIPLLQAAAMPLLLCPCRGNLPRHAHGRQGSIRGRARADSEGFEMHRECVGGLASRSGRSGW